MKSVHKKTLLLVEDEVIIAMSQKMFLEKYGYKVLTINTGEKAIEILKGGTEIELALLPESRKAPLEKIGYEVILATSAEKAVELCNQNTNIDLVLMDIDLGKGMDGTQAAEIILTHRDIPLLFLSSHTEPEMVEKTEKITSYGYVVKDSSITVLDASIKMAFKLFEANKKISNELTERKRLDALLRVSENRYRRLFETTKEGILILDAESGMIVDVNPFMIDLLGYSHQLFMGKTIWDIGFLKDILGNKDKFLELRKTNYIRYENLPLETSNGKIIEVEFISNVYEVGEAKVIQCNIRDITERKEAEFRIQKLLSEKEILLQEVHHRIKNSMNTIRGLLSLQAETLEDPTAVEALKDSGSRVQSMMLLYDKLYRSLNYTEVSIREYLSSLVDEIIENFPNSKLVRIEKEIDDFPIDAKKLQAIGIIINELLTNSMKYAFAGKDRGLIKVSVTLSGTHVRIAIQDDGKGIPADVDFENSTGFGLTLVRMLASQIDSTIRMEREKGTTFILEFEN